MLKSAWGTLAFMIGAIVVGVAIGFITAPFGGDMGQSGRAACDRWVETLLTSSDQTEILRAGIIVREVPCSVSRRLK